jgi:hypothetical protein
MTDIFEMMSRNPIENPMSLCNSANLGATPCNKKCVTKKARRVTEKNF